MASAKSGMDMSSAGWMRLAAAVLPAMAVIAAGCAEEEDTAVTPTPAVTVSITPSPSPTPLARIAFVSDRDGNNEIYVMNADGSGQIRLTDAGGEHPAWSPGP